MQASFEGGRDRLVIAIPAALGLGMGLAITLSLMGVETDKTLVAALCWGIGFLLVGFAIPARACVASESLARQWRLLASSSAGLVLGITVGLRLLDVPPESAQALSGKTGALLDFCFFLLSLWLYFHYNRIVEPRFWVKSKKVFTIRTQAFLMWMETLLWVAVVCLVASYILQGIGPMYASGRLVVLISFSGVVLLEHSARTGT